jgi:hypothetical protein
MYGQMSSTSRRCGNSSSSGTKPRQPPRDVPTIGVIALPEASTKLGLLDAEHDQMATNARRECVEDDTDTRQVKRLAPDHDQLGDDDRIAHEAEEAIRDEAPGACVGSWVKVGSVRHRS